MPRTYIRKTKNYSYTVDTLKEALNAIKKDGRKIRDAGRHYNIPEATLRKYLAKPMDEIQQPSLGRKSVIPSNVELQMVEFIVQLCNMFYGLTPKDLRRLTFKYVEDNGISHSFNKELCLAGKDWMYNFLKRHPSIKLRQPENTSLNRIHGFNKVEVQKFFENIRSVMEKMKIEPMRLYNQDETGITTVQKKCSKVFALKGSKRVGSATSAERGRTITGVFCMSAGGHFIPPMLIYPRKRMSANLQKSGPDGAVYCCSNNGWSNAELFNEWLVHFKKHAHPTADSPVLLILDNHISHISIEAYTFCRENHIHMVSLPPHTSHRLQPLDLTFFGPLKNALFREYDLYMMQTGHKRITEYEVAELLNNAFLKVATMSNASSGFRAAGIHPYNPDKFSDIDFAPARDLQELTVEAVPNNDSPSASFADLDRPLASVADQERPSTTSDEKTHRVGLCDDPLPSTSSGIFDTPTSHNKFLSYLPAFSQKKNPKVENKTRKPREKQHSEILTSTPIKIKLETDLEKKKQKEEFKKRKLENKKNKVVKSISFGKNVQKKIKKNIKKKIRPKEESDDSDVDMAVSLCDDNELDDIDMAFFDNGTSTADDNELCGLCGDHGKEKELWYRCTQCGKWYHAACTANESAKDFICDLCQAF